jgi:nucleoside phosphorylase
MLCVVVALRSEAQPIIEHFGLRRHADRPFPAYRNESIALSVSGIGKARSAAAVGHAGAMYAASPMLGWLNIGIAGHRELAVGEPLLAVEITDHGSGRRHYPGLVFAAPCRAGRITTFDRPQLDYPHGTACDMEASAFFEAAARFSKVDLIHSLKVISDNPATEITRLDRGQISALMAANVTLIAEVAERIQTAARSLASPSDRMRPR